MVCWGSRKNLFDDSLWDTPNQLGHNLNCKCAVKNISLKLRYRFFVLPRSNSHDLFAWKVQKALFTGVDLHSFSAQHLFKQLPIHALQPFKNARVYILGGNSFIQMYNCLPLVLNQWVLRCCSVHCPAHNRSNHAWLQSYWYQFYWLDSRLYTGNSNMHVHFELHRRTRLFNNFLARKRSNKWKRWVDQHYKLIRRRCSNYQRPNARDPL